MSRQTASARLATDKNLPSIHLASLAGRKRATAKNKLRSVRHVWRPPCVKLNKSDKASFYAKNSDLSTNTTDDRKKFQPIWNLKYLLQLSPQNVGLNLAEYDLRDAPPTVEQHSKRQSAGLIAQTTHEADPL